MFTDKTEYSIGEPVYVCFGLYALQQYETPRFAVIQGRISIQAEGRRAEVAHTGVPGEDVMRSVLGYYVLPSPWMHGPGPRRLGAGELVLGVEWQAIAGPIHTPYLSKPGRYRLSATAQARRSNDRMEPLSGPDLEIVVKEDEDEDAARARGLFLSPLLTFYLSSSLVETTELRSAVRELYRKYPRHPLAKHFVLVLASRMMSKGFSMADTPLPHRSAEELGKIGVKEYASWRINQVQEWSSWRADRDWRGKRLSTYDPESALPLLEQCEKEFEDNLPLLYKVLDLRRWALRAIGDREGRIRAKERLKEVEARLSKMLTHRAKARIEASRKKAEPKPPVDDP